jgi:cytochrome c biogenesis protein
MSARGVILSAGTAQLLPFPRLKHHTIIIRGRAELNDKTSPVRTRRGTGAIALEFLGSMNLAITLLVVIAIASVIGTVLKQNEPYTNYVMKFGPFWFEVFKSLSLFDIYGAAWFLVLLGFLLVSTSICVWRNTPHILRDMRHSRLDVQEKSLRSFHLKAEWDSTQALGDATAHAESLLGARGYRVRKRAQDGQATVAAMKGGLGRLGYILSHASIVVICIGGLIDGNLPLKLKELGGDLRVETRDIPASEVPAESVLGTNNLSFRGSISIPEGASAKVVYLALRDGYLIQQLPFSIELEQFRIEHYPSGMPKSFESDLIIHDDELKEPLRQTIKVNHPLLYKGYAIYQSSFGDGGSELKTRAWSLDLPAQEPLELDSGVNRFRRLMTTRGERTLEFTDFKLYNIFPVGEDDASGKKFHNYGPSMVFKLRNPAGEALEYVNYMLPVDLEGRRFFMSGMRATPSEEYRYLYIPADAAGTPQRFMRVLAAVHDAARVRRVIEAQIGDTLSADKAGKDVRSTMIDSIGKLVVLFVEEGIEGVARQAEASLPPEQRQEAINSYVNVLQGVLGALYVELLRDEGVNLEQGVSEEDSRFFDDTLNTLSMLVAYGSPFYLQLAEFNHIEASGLQIARAPGKDIVYLGCAMLMAGVFMMFYMHQRRIWVRLEQRDGGTALLFAGSGHRNRLEFEREFRALQAELEQAVPPHPASA